ncbi:hypothetical protein Hanom_Chr01g00015381 [Helianthus anomalus]
MVATEVFISRFNRFEFRPTPSISGRHQFWFSGLFVLDSVQVSQISSVVSVKSIQVRLLLSQLLRVSRHGLARSNSQLGQLSGQLGQSWSAGSVTVQFGYGFGSSG